MSEPEITKRGPGRPKRASQVEREELKPVNLSVDDDDEMPGTAPRTQSRLSSRSEGRARAVGRDGEVLSRSIQQIGDPFEAFQPPKDWSYQWVPIAVTGNTEIISDQVHQMHQQGWRPVPAGRYAGTLLPANVKKDAPIVRGSMMLMERPLSLTKEAQAEDLYNANKLVSDRNESLMLSGKSMKRAMPAGFEMSNKYRGTGGQVNTQMAIDQEAEGLKPDYKLANPGE